MSETTAQTGPVRTFAPVADAYVDSSIPNTNNGTKKELLADASPVQQAYLKFQLAGLTGNTVTSAKLRLYVTTNGSIKSMDQSFPRSER
ncbi:MAG: DNRLRE domain-containing protein [Chloroflexi bacterium]|nr:MAG: DNRLRE domain-containing protein [Chloroflexota bacterium]